MSPDTKYEPNCLWQEHHICESGGDSELQMETSRGDEGSGGSGSDEGIAGMAAGTVIGLDQCKDYCMRGIQNYPLGHELSSARTWCCEYDPAAADAALPTSAVCGLYTIESDGAGAPTTLDDDPNTRTYALDMWNLKDCGAVASTSYKLIKLGEAIENLSVRLDLFRRMELSRTVQQVGEMDVSGSYSTLAYVGLALGLAGVGAVAYVMIKEAPEKKGLFEYTDAEYSDVSSSE